MSLQTPGLFPSKVTGTPQLFFSARTSFRTLGPPGVPYPYPPHYHGEARELSVSPCSLASGLAVASPLSTKSPAQRLAPLATHPRLATKREKKKQQPTPWPSDTSPSIAGRSSRLRTRSSLRNCVVAARSSRSRFAKPSARRTWPSGEALALARIGLALRSVPRPTATTSRLPQNPRYAHGHFLFVSGLDPFVLLRLQGDPSFLCTLPKIMLSATWGRRASLF